MSKVANVPVLPIPEIKKRHVKFLTIIRYLIFFLRYTMLSITLFLLPAEQ